jgi:hypothetical protein
MGCGLCKQMWVAVSGQYSCSFGHLQQVEFIKSPVNIEAGDEILHSDGQVIYVLKQVGVLVVGYCKPIDRPETFEYFKRLQNQSKEVPPMPEIQSSAPEELTEIHYRQILQLSEDYSVIEIKQNRNRLIVENRSDKVQHFGGAAQNVAEQKMDKINEAYEYFKRKLTFD